MTEEKRISIDKNIIFLEVNANLRLPHDMQPGSFPGGCKEDWTEAEWNAYQWNPPQFVPDLAFDENASEKPSWDDLTGATNEGPLVAKRDALAIDLRVQAQDRIIAAYEATDTVHEFQKRLRGDTTPEQDTERDRLRAVYKTLKDNLDGMDMAALESFDATDDAHWAKPA